MQRRVYLVAFALVLVSVLFNAVSSALFWAGRPLPYIPFAAATDMLGHPVPAMLRGLLPWQARVILFYAFLLLMLRRLISFKKQRSLSAPASMTRGPYILLVIALSSLALGILGLMLSILINAGSGVPAGMLMIPCVLLLTPTLGWIEMKSLFKDVLAR